MKIFGICENCIIFGVRFIINSNGTDSEIKKQGKRKGESPSVYLLYQQSVDRGDLPLMFNPNLLFMRSTETKTRESLADSILRDLRNVAPLSEIRDTLMKMTMCYLAAEDDSDSRDDAYYAHAVVDDLLKTIQRYQNAEMSLKN